MTLGSRVEKKSSFEPIDNADLADKERLLTYFARAVTAFEATGRVRYFANATFDSEHKAIDTAGGGRSTVSFRKLVVPTSNVQVPATRPPCFPVARGVDLRPINALSEEGERDRRREAYVVIGAGKTGADAVLLLLRRGVPATCITWIVSQDCWYFNRDHIFGGVDMLLCAATQMMDALLASADADAFFLALERCGLTGRIDPHGAVPQRFRGATFDTDELRMLRDMHTASRVVRLGRVTVVDAAGLALERGRIPMPSLTDTLVLDASASAID